MTGPVTTNDTKFPPMPMPRAEDVPRVPLDIPPERKHWLVRPSTIKLLWRYGMALLVGLTALDFFIHPHAYFGIDGTFGFNSWYGFATCAAMVIGAKALGLLLKRPDTYYEDQAAATPKPEHAIPVTGEEGV